LVRAEHVALLPSGVAPLIVKEPRAVFAAAAAALVSRRDFDPTALAVPASVKQEADVVIGRGVVIGEQVEIGQGTTIGPNTVIGPGVAIGRNCRIGANVVIYCALIGDRVTISSGSVIGEVGFGHHDAFFDGIEGRTSFLQHRPSAFIGRQAMVPGREYDRSFGLSLVRLRHNVGRLTWLDYT
jgi:UDP-3-O-[3-hydroxymyristoyl] glucosamine N-acyltransferase